VFEQQLADALPARQAIGSAAIEFVQHGNSRFP
jgi:hypothetical protein